MNFLHTEISSRFFIYRTKVSKQLFKFFKNKQRNNFFYVSKSCVIATLTYFNRNSRKNVRFNDDCFFFQKIDDVNNNIQVAIVIDRFAERKNSFEYRRENSRF